MTPFRNPTANPKFRSRFRRQRVAWIHLYGHCCAGLERFCPIERVICTDFGREFSEIRARAGVEFLSLEEQTQRRQVASDVNMQRLVPELGARIRKELTATGGTWTLVCPYACRGLKEFAEEGGWRLASPDVDLAAELSDKTVLRAALDELRLPQVPGRWTLVSALRYDDLSREFGPRFVLQLRSGSGGSGTAIVSSGEDLTRAARRFRTGAVHVARFLGERSVNINAVATPDGVAVSWPNLQIVGLPELHARPGQYAGNDYSATATFPRECIDDVLTQTERLGRWAASRGHCGLFGLDFVFDDASGRAYAVDFNPRWQGSTTLLTQAEMRAGRTPLAALEMAYQAGAISTEDLLREYGDPRPVQGSQLGLHWRGPRAVRLRAEIDAGVTAIKTGKLVTRDPSAELSSVQSGDEVLLTGGVPSKGTLIEPGANVLKILDTGAAIESATQQLTAKVADVVRLVYEGLGLAKIPPRAAGAASG